MQITFDPLSPTDRNTVSKILADMAPESVAQAMADPAPSVDAVGTPVPVVPQVPQTSIVPPPQPPMPPVAPPLPGIDDPLPNPSNIRAPSEVAPVGGQLSSESFRARIQAVGQKMGMEKLKAFVLSMGYAKLSEIPETAYVQVIAGAEELQ